MLFCTQPLSEFNIHFLVGCVQQGLFKFVVLFVHDYIFVFTLQALPDIEKEMESLEGLIKNLNGITNSGTVA